MQKAAINNIEGMKDGVPRKNLLVVQVFVSSDSMGSEPIIGAGICIASTDLLFTEHTVEQASLLLAVILHCNIRDACTAVQDSRSISKDVYAWRSLSMMCM